VGNLNDENVKTCLEKLQKYNLSQAETMQILNFAPKTEVELYLVITLLHSRYVEFARFHRVDDFQIIEELEARLAQLHVTEAELLEDIKSSFYPQ
jgi:hypothetical protein